jgi:hypothetical protein
VPHELIFSMKPAAMGKIAAIVVDESAWQDGLEGVGLRPIVMAVDALGQADRRHGDAGSPDWETLQDHRAKARRALADLTDGALLREAFEAVGLRAADAKDARALELLRKIEPNMRPGMSKEERRQARCASGDAPSHIGMRTKAATTCSSLLDSFGHASQAVNS